MALFTEAAVKANLRNRDGRRVFYLGREDRLTPGARQNPSVTSSYPAGRFRTSLNT